MQHYWPVGSEIAPKSIPVTNSSKSSTTLKGMEAVAALQVVAAESSGLLSLISDGLIRFGGRLSIYCCRPSVAINALIFFTRRSPYSFTTFSPSTPRPLSSATVVGTSSQIAAVASWLIIFQSVSRGK